MLSDNLKKIAKSPSLRLRVALLVIIAGSLLFGLLQSIENPYEDQVDSFVQVKGRVAAEVDTRQDSQRVVLDGVDLDGDYVDGKILVTLPLHPRVDHGDQLVFDCKLKIPEPFNGFNYDRYLATRGIFAVCYRPVEVDIFSGDQWTIVGTILSIKRRVVDTLGLMLPEPHVAFVSGLLFGGNSSMSADLRDEFATTGTSHILAASGFNVSLFTMVFLGWVMGWFGRKPGIIAAAVLLGVYVITAGATPAVLRAAIMASLILMSAWMGRKANMTNAMLLAGAIMVVINPRLAFDDVGFQLSFVATGALLFVAPRWESFFNFIPKSFGLRESFVASIAASVITLPIILWHFGSISLISPIANLIILPLVPYLMAVAFMALPLFAVFHSFSNLASILSLPAWALSSFILHLIRWLSAVPHAIITPTSARVLAIISAIIIPAIWIVHSRLRNAILRVRTN